MHADLIYLVQSVGYVGLFLIVFLESFPMTFFLPGDSLLFTTGFLASQGYLSLPLLVVLLFIAGTIGYLLSYTFGQKIIKKFFTNPNSKIFNPKYVEYTKEFYKKYGAKTVIIGRFVPIVRSFGPALAGVAEVQYTKFAQYTIIGGIAWTVGVTSVGYFLGRSLPQAGEYVTPIILIIIFISLLPTVYEYIQHRRSNNI